MIRPCAPSSWPRVRVTVQPGRRRRQMTYCAAVRAARIGQDVLPRDGHVLGMVPVGAVAVLVVEVADHHEGGVPGVDADVGPDAVVAELRDQRRQGPERGRGRRDLGVGRLGDEREERDVADMSLQTSRRRRRRRGSRRRSRSSPHPSTGTRPARRSPRAGRCGGPGSRRRDRRRRRAARRAARSRASPGCRLLTVTPSRRDLARERLEEAR